MLVGGLALVPVLLAGCGGGDQNVIAPASHQAHEISTLWWVMLGASVVGFGIIATLLLLGWIRRHRENLPFGGGDRAATALVIGLGVVVPILLLSTLFVWSDIFVLRSTAAPEAGSTRMTIRVIGHQWFWEVRYPGTNAVTANEIHIPVRTPVNVVGTTDDVIHSFWVPELNRKVDLIPGRQNRVLLDANRVGVFRGQCAEFCGLQHAHMAMRVVVQPRAQFRAWLRNMSGPARSPQTAEQRRGQAVFLSQTCSACHQVRGTNAARQVGPDLTHLATRQTLAAVTIPNSPAELAEWIRDPQHVKPGSKMPDLELTNADVTALVAYLGSLK